MSEGFLDRFVLLFHDGFDEPDRAAHYDLMLESNGVLKTWAVADHPFEQKGLQQTAEQLPDHRVMYLDYEGPVSDNRGRVSRVVGGDLKWIEVGSDRIVADIQFEESPNLSSLLGRIELVLNNDDQWAVCFSSDRAGKGGCEE